MNSNPPIPEQAMEMVRWLNQNMTKDQYKFSVNVNGSLYDIYHFVKDGRPGTLAFTIFSDGTVGVAVYDGTLTEAEAAKELSAPRLQNTVKDMQTAVRQHRGQQPSKPVNPKDLN